MRNEGGASYRSLHASEPLGGCEVETFCWKDLVFDKYTPIGVASTREALLFLPSTQGERPTIPSRWRGKVTTFALQPPSAGGISWRNDIPENLGGWVKEVQLLYPEVAWTLYGQSRGGAWGAILADDASLTWSRVFLVAPYVVPRRKEQPPGAGLRQKGKRLRVAFGTEDDNLADTQSFVDQCGIRETCVMEGYSGLNHDASLRQAEEFLWITLSSTL